MTDDCVSFKILLCGESGVGKTSLSNQFTSHRFNCHEQSTVGVDFRSKIISVGGSRIRVMLWDSAGQEQFRSVPPMYYRGADAALFVYDVTNADSFRKLDSWLRDFQQYNTKEKSVKMLVGNKIDLTDERAIQSHDGVKFARSNEMLFIETSAATSDRVEEAFMGLIDMIVRQSPTLAQPKILPGYKESSPIQIKSPKSSKKHKPNCCGTKKSQLKLPHRSREGGL